MKSLEDDFVYGNWTPAMLEVPPVENNKANYKGKKKQDTKTSKKGKTAQGGQNRRLRKQRRVVSIGDDTTLPYINIFLLILGMILCVTSGHSVVPGVLGSSQSPSTSQLPVPSQLLTTSQLLLLPTTSHFLVSSQLPEA